VRQAGHHSPEKYIAKIGAEKASEELISPDFVSNVGPRKQEFGDWLLERDYVVLF